MRLSLQLQFSCKRVTSMNDGSVMDDIRAVLDMIVPPPSAHA